MKNQALAAELFATIAELRRQNVAVTFVHGGGPEIDLMLKKVGIEPRRVDGLRVTDAATLEVVEMVLAGKVNKSLVSLANAVGLNALGLSAVDASIALASAKDEKLGFVGEINKVNPQAITRLQDSGFFPIICSIAADRSGQHLNVNADDLAAALAGALKVDLFVLVTDVPGLMANYPDLSTVVPKLKIAEAQDLFSSGKISSGMIPKVQACCRAIQEGAAASLITDRMGREVLKVLQEPATALGTLISAT